MNERYIKISDDFGLNKFEIKGVYFRRNVLQLMAIN